MRITFLLIFAVLMACSEDESPIVQQEPPVVEPPIVVEPPVVKECRLVKMVSLTASQTVETAYSYNDKDQIVGQIRTRDGVVDFSYVIFYDSEGMVDRVDDGAIIVESDYTTDGKIKKRTLVDKATSEVKETQEYSWSPDSLHVIYKKPADSKPYATMGYKFSGENIVHTMYESYSYFGADEFFSTSEVTYSGFDAGVNQYYLALKNRPGYGVVSKNNYAKEISTYKTYKNGTIESTSTSTRNYTYVYNKSNATISFVTTDEATGSAYTTNITYDDCPE